MDCEWYPHWATAIYTGMRNGELYTLRWANVDFENQVILVNCSWGSRNGFKSTKSGDDRVVPLAPMLLPILQELRIKHPGVSEFVLPRLAKWDKGEQARELRFFLSFTTPFVSKRRYSTWRPAQPRTVDLDRYAEKAYSDSDGRSQLQ